MFSYIGTLILLNLIKNAVLSPDVTTIPETHSSRKIPDSHQKHVKRSHIRPLIDSRILSKKPPLNVLENGQYFINHHYIYCENFDQHSLDQYKSTEENKFFTSLDPLVNTDVTFNGNKHLHILHLPKDKTHDFNDINLHLSLANAHKSQLPPIDLDLNKNFDSFEVNLGTFKPPKLDTVSLLNFNTKPPLQKIVTPLIQGQITAEKPSNFNFDKFINTNHNSFQLQNGFRESIVDPPHFEQQPLEHDIGKSSYDTPGAVDSYGHPITSTSQNIHINHLNGLKKDEIFIPEEYYNQLNEIHELQRKRRQELKLNMVNRDGRKHPNHKYD